MCLQLPGEGLFVQMARSPPTSSPFHHAQVDEVKQHISKIETLVSELESCEYQGPVFSTLLGQIQKTIDDLNLQSYSNLQSWVKRLDEQVSGGGVVSTIGGVVSTIGGVVSTSGYMSLVLG